MYFNDPFDRGLPFYRVRVNDRKLERVATIGGYGQLAGGQWGWWTGLGPEDSLLAARDIRFVAKLSRARSCTSPPIKLYAMPHE